MSKNGVEALIGLLAKFHPGWVLAILVAGIMAYRLPAIIREVFTGLREQMKVSADIALKLRKIGHDVEQREKTAKTKGTRKVRTS
jgi:hypothetical protein